MVSVQFLILFIKWILWVHSSGDNIVVAYRFNHFSSKDEEGDCCVLLFVVGQLKTWKKKPKISSACTRRWAAMAWTTELLTERSHLWRSKNRWLRDTRFVLLRWPLVPLLPLLSSVPLEHEVFLSEDAANKRTGWILRLFIHESDVCHRWLSLKGTEFLRNKQADAQWFHFEVWGEALSPVRKAVSWKSSQSQGEKAEPRHGSAIFSCTQRQGLDHEELSSKKHGIAVSFVSIGSLDCFSSVGPGHPALGVPAGAGVGPEGPRGLCQPQPLCASASCSQTAVAMSDLTITFCFVPACFGVFVLQEWLLTPVLHMQRWQASCSWYRWVFFSN